MKFRSFFYLIFLVGCFALILLQYVVYRRRVSTKHILYWTGMFNNADFNFGFGSTIFENCTFSNCFATNNRELLPIHLFDAVLFHGVEYNEVRDGRPARRSPSQVYVFSNQESPINTPRLLLNDFYNWTMTYRLDSDVLRPYGYYLRNITHYKPPSLEEIQRRPKKIAWFVSNCETFSEREKIVQEIQKHIPVDVYGKCGNYTCMRNAQLDCYAMLEENYKFYLSFENSDCQDYVTEKLFYPLQKNVVPIVYGGADYSKIAPPQSVINIKHFKNLTSFVQYLRYLDKNPKVYLKYFEWKKNFTVTTDNNLCLCSLCKKLNLPRTFKTYINLASWWEGRVSLLSGFSRCASGFVNKFIMTRLKSLH